MVEVYSDKSGNWSWRHASGEESYRLLPSREAAVEEAKEHGDVVVVHERSAELVADFSMEE